MLRVSLWNQLFVVVACWFALKWCQGRQRVENPIDDSPRIKESPDEDLFPYNPPCDIRFDDALSAISRAMTNSCRQTIADFACRNERGEAVPKFLKNTCPGDQKEIGKYLGCYPFNLTEPTLAHGEAVQNNTVTRCITFCRTAGRALAGVKNGTECHCGHDESVLEGRKDKLCNVTCSGDAKAICGGETAVGVYSTGLTDRKHVYWQLPAEGENWGAVKIAFFLAFNGRQIRQVKQLLRSIYQPQHLYLIHVEARADVMYKELSYLEEKYENIRLQGDRIRGNWGSPSLLHGIRSGIRELLKMGEWDYWINLSESCFPIEFVGDLEDFLAANRGLSFLASPTTNPFDSLKSQGLSQAFVECDGYLYKAGPKSLPEGIRMDYGSDWFVFHREFAEFVVDSSDPLILGLEKVFNYSFLAPEAFFHTAVQNSRFCNRVSNANLRWVHWANKKSEGQCHCNIYGDVCGCSPVAYRSESLSDVVENKPAGAYFARKFDATISQSVITSLDEFVSEPWPEGTPGVYSYWEPIFLRRYDHPTEFSNHVLHVCNTLLSHHEKLSDVSIAVVDEIHSLYENDTYTGFVVKVLRTDGITSEMLLKPRRNFKRNEEASVEGSKLLNLMVGENYIRKERVFKNRAAFVHSRSNLGLEHRWLSSESRINVTFYWIDPLGGVVAEMNETTKNGTEVHSFVANITTPLIPGEWTVIAVESGLIAGYLDFPVFSAQIPESVSAEIRFPASSIGPVSAVKTFISMRKDRISGEDKLLSTFLTTKYYSLEDVCVVSTGFFAFFGSYGQGDCLGKIWSSLSPDPKSDF